MPTSTTLSNIWAKGKNEIKMSSGVGENAFCRGYGEEEEEEKKRTTETGKKN